MSAPNKGRHGEPWSGDKSIWPKWVVDRHGTPKAFSELCAERIVEVINAMDGVREVEPGAIRRLIEAVRGRQPPACNCTVTSGCTEAILDAALADIELSE